MSHSTSRQGYCSILPRAEQAGQRTIVLVVPVLGLLGILVGDGGRDVIMALGLLVIRVGDLLALIPVLGLLGLGVLWQ
jgi:hypothetical protein